MKVVMPTQPQPNPAVFCCLIIRWKASHPERLLDLSQEHAERLLEDMVIVLKDHIAQLEIRELVAPGRLGRRIRLWDSCQSSPCHSTTWFAARARAFMQHLLSTRTGPTHEHE